MCLLFVKPLAIKLLLERLHETTPVAKESLVRFRWFTGVVVFGDSGDCADVVCYLEQAPSLWVGFAVIRDIFGQDKVQGVVEGYAYPALTVVVVDGNGGVFLEEVKVLEDERCEVTPDSGLKLSPIMDAGGVVSQNEGGEGQFADQSCELGEQPLPIAGGHGAITLVSVQKVFPVERHVGKAGGGQTTLVAL